MGVNVKKSAMLSMATVLTLGTVLVACSDKKDEETKPGTENATTTDSQQNTETTAETVKPLTISVFYGVQGPIPNENNKIYKKIKDELGVTLKEEFLVGDIEQKLGVMIAGGDYPDIITANPKLVAAGAMQPLEDLIEQHAPRLKEHYAKVWEQMKDPEDGHIYWLPNYGVYQGDYVTTWYSGPAFWIQKAVLKEFGYPKPKTLDEYFDLIEKYKEKYPEIDGQPTIGFTTLAYDWRKWPLINVPAHLSGHPNDGIVVVDHETNVAKAFFATDIDKPYYKKLNEMNAKGLIDKEAFAQNYDQYQAKISSGRVLGMFDQHWNFNNAETALTDAGKIERTYLGIPIVYDESIKDYYLDRPALNLNNGFGITKDAKDPVAILKFFDTLLDEKWMKVLQWGIEGEDYLVDENGKFYLNEQMRANFNNADWKASNVAQSLHEYMPKLQGQYSDGNAAQGAGFQPDEFFAAQKDFDKEVYAAYGAKLPSDLFSPPPENRVSYPAWSIDLIEGSPAKIANTKMEELALKHLPKIIMSKPENFESAWEDYVKAMSKVDVKAYEDRINEQLKWRAETWTSSNGSFE
ncbi:ABC transporter substrate-binding protein [Paenibacillus xylaniclasticus]|uniref:ABC transporter substrate-binding protein n=1 Tax=Paenibacillus xylaniclasticus TaxID=588083 RepID=UPI000FD7ED02|nr:MULTISPECIES: ABC transporter substrate-binding protein [Paenibacillus]GFN30176.1 ABC transporter substrate-binding protein [Paenibacillus curdlanolyticus]